MSRVLSSQESKESELLRLDARSVLRKFRTKELSPVELMGAVLNQVHQWEPQLTATTASFPEAALAEARRAEGRYLDRASEPRPLEGLPVAMKDEIPIAGQPWSNGSLKHKERIAEMTAPLAERVIGAGGIVHVRTAVPEFCCAGFTHSRLTGVSRNPWNRAYSVGGSSGGSGAAVAAGYSPLATGSDIGGSIRIPASFNGVVGFKPPYGRVPDLPPFSLDSYCQNGPIGRTSDDCALLQGVISGPHPADHATISPKHRISPNESVEGRRIAYSVALGGYPVRGDVAENTEAVVGALRTAGATVDEVGLDWAPEVVREIAFAHFGTSMSADIADEVGDDWDQVSDYVREFVACTERCAQKLPERKRLLREHELQQQLAVVFEQYSAFICPTAAVPAIPAGKSYLGMPAEVEGITVGHYMDIFLTMGFNICGRVPVLNVPSGVGDSGVPTGVQIAGAPYDDDSVFVIGRALERARQPPCWFEFAPSSAVDVEENLI